MEGTCLTPKLWAETPKAPEKSEKYEKRVERKYISFRAYRRGDLVNFGRVAIEKKGVPDGPFFKRPRDTV